MGVVRGSNGRFQHAAHNGRGKRDHAEGVADYALNFTDAELRGEMAAFDYAALDAETRIVVQQRTGEIKSLMRRTAQDIIDIGQKLIEVKARLGHGSFGVWLKAEFEWSQYTAINFMRVSEKFGNFPNLGDIAPSALYLLASPSTPDAARDEALQRAATGEVITFSSARDITSKHKAALEQFPAALQPAIVQIAEAQAGTLRVPLTPKLIERTGTVLTEAATTGCVDTGDGESTPLTAALTLEQAETLKRQQEYIRDRLAKKEAKQNAMRPKFERLAELEAQGVYIGSVWSFGPRANYAGDAGYHGNSIPQIVENAVLLYTQPGDTVLDPMAGSGTTLDVCELLSRRCIGVDIQQTRADITLGDARALTLADESVDFAFWHPPYWSLVRYSTLPTDLSNMDWDDFLQAASAVIGELTRVLKPGRALAILSGDLVREGRYYPVARKLANMAEAAGLVDSGTAIKTTINSTSQIVKGKTIWAELAYSGNLKVEHDILSFFRKQ